MFGMSKINGKQSTENECIDITLEGITKDKEWTRSLDFDYANRESFLDNRFICEYRIVIKTNG